MSSIDANSLEAVLAQFQDPYLGTDLVAGGVVREAEMAAGRAHVRLSYGIPVARYRATLIQELREHLERAGAGADAEVQVDWEVKTHAVQRQLKPIAGVKNVVAVASAKGGVGKSTTAANLALALAAEGAAVGVLDADIYGPSQPRMLGLRGQRPVSEDGKSMLPLTAHKICCMSIGFLVDEEQPMVWRGPMVTQALSQLLNDTRWGELDYLVVDMPPGTGDIQLTLSQRVPVSGAVIVTTPQDIALADARKGLKMFEKVAVPVLGVVENMGTHVCSNCGHEEAIFGAGGGSAMAAQYDVPFLGSLPLDIRIREQADSGRPTVLADPDGALARKYHDIALRMAARLAAAGKDYSRLFPKIVIEDN